MSLRDTSWPFFKSLTEYSVMPAAAADEDFRLAAKADPETIMAKAARTATTTIHCLRVTRLRGDSLLSI